MKGGREGRRGQETAAERRLRGRCWGRAPCASSGKPGAGRLGDRRGGRCSRAQPPDGQSPPSLGDRVRRRERSGARGTADPAPARSAAGTRPAGWSAPPAGRAPGSRSAAAQPRPGRRVRSARPGRGKERRPRGAGESRRPGGRSRPAPPRSRGRDENGAPRAGAEAAGTAPAEAGPEPL